MVYFAIKIIEEQYLKKKENFTLRVGWQRDGC